MTGHPPTHGRRAGTRTDGFRAGEPSPADARSSDARSGEARTGNARTGDARSGKARTGEAHTGELGAGERGWAALHGGVRPSALVRLWLRGVQRLAAGPVARVSPDALSVAGVAAAGGAAAVAAQGGRWPLVAAALVVLAGVLDGLDGAVALHTGRARPLGAVVDALADRVGDLLLVATLAVLGAPPAWCVAAGVLTLLHEYLRARAGAAGMPGVGALTVAERPTRLVLVTVACLGAGTLPGGTPLTGWDWATVCAIGWVVVGAVGLVQLSVGVARTTPRRFPT